MSDAARPRSAAPTQGVAVELTGLRRDYGDVHALDGLDLHLEPGRAGRRCSARPGCGKTTALRILAGLERQRRRHASRSAARTSSHVPANKRDMGMVFQAYSLFPHLTVLDNVAFGLKLRGPVRAERRDPGRRHARPGRPRRPEGPLRQPALGRPAAAGGAGARARDRAVACCCSTSRCRRSTPRCACSCATRSAGCSARSAPRPSSSPTTRRRRWPSPTGSG